MCVCVTGCLSIDAMNGYNSVEVAQYNEWNLFMNGDSIHMTKSEKNENIRAPYSYDGCQCDVPMRTTQSNTKKKLKRVTRSGA